MGGAHLMSIQVDVVIVGAGPAGISAAYTLADKGVDTLVLERGQYPGAKNISGGVLYGRELASIIPDFAQRGCPMERNIVESRLWYLSLEGGFSLSYRDEYFRKNGLHNSFTVGRAKFDRWFAEQARKKGARIVCSTVVTDLLRDSIGCVIGVCTDRPEGEVECRVVLLADGINSPLAAKTGLRPEPHPQDVALAVKEVIELNEEVIEQRFNVGPGEGVTIEVLGEVTLGMDGVGAIYTNSRSLSICIGANLQDMADSRVKPYEMLEDFKAHPMVSPLIQGGRPTEYMAHWLAEGGYKSIPKLCGDGYLIAGDSAGLFNAPHREGSNLAMTSGRLAAEAIFDALQRGDFSSKGLGSYVERLQASYVIQDLFKYRRFGYFKRNCKEELFGSLPRSLSGAAREMLRVDGVPKRIKAKKIRRLFQDKIGLRRMARILLSAWRGTR
jgi:electron transfer flavoprotein-quinone oxidoreductase